MLTVDDLRWAADKAEQLVDTWENMLGGTDSIEADAAIKREVNNWQARTARFRAAAEAMEREGKRDGD